MVNKLDARQIRGLRASLNIEHSYGSGITNTEILAKATALAAMGSKHILHWIDFFRNKQNRHMIKAKRISEIFEEMQLKLSGKII